MIQEALAQRLKAMQEEHDRAARAADSKIAEAQHLKVGIARMRRDMRTAAMLDAIRDERQRQDERWGGHDHDRMHTVREWYDLIAPRIAEASPAETINARQRNLLLEATALLVAWLECLEAEGDQHR